MAGPRLVGVGDVDLEVDVLGRGEPVLVVQTALDADELLPLAEQIARAGRYRVIHHRRRGYAGSGPASSDASIRGDAADARALVQALEAEPVHVVGASYSAAVALSLASRAPEAVRTVTVVEPPPFGGWSATEFRAANTRLHDTFRTSGPHVALEELMTMLVGPDWRRSLEQERPGAVAAIDRDATTFFEHDVPALVGWRFGTAEADAIRCPVLCIGGSDSHPWFGHTRTTLRALLPQAEDATVPGAGHLVASTHPSRTARLVVDFLERHR